MLGGRGQDPNLTLPEGTALGMSHTAPRLFQCTGLPGIWWPGQGPAPRPQAFRATALCGHTRSGMLCGWRWQLPECCHMTPGRVQSRLELPEGRGPSPGPAVSILFSGLCYAKGFVQRLTHSRFSWVVPFFPSAPSWPNCILRSKAMGAQCS